MTQTALDELDREVPGRMAAIERFNKDTITKEVALDYLISRVDAFSAGTEIMVRTTRWDYMTRTFRLAFPDIFRCATQDPRYLAFCKEQDAADRCVVQCGAVGSGPAVILGTIPKGVTVTADVVKTAIYSAAKEQDRKEEGQLTQIKLVPMGYSSDGALIWYR